MLFTVGSADLLNGIQCFGECSLEQFKRLVLVFLQVLYPLAQYHGEIDHHWIEEQDQQCQLPVHPQQHCRRTDQRQHGDQELRYRHADEIVYRVQIGDKMGGDFATTQRFVFAHGNPLQAQQQITANTIDHVFGNQAELAGLPYTQHDRDETQCNRQNQYAGDIQHRAVPRGGKNLVHDADHFTRLLE